MLRTWNLNRRMTPPAGGPGVLTMRLTTATIDDDANGPPQSQLTGGSLGRQDLGHTASWLGVTSGQDVVQSHGAHLRANCHLTRRRCL